MQVLSRAVSVVECSKRWRSVHRRLYFEEIIQYDEDSTCNPNMGNNFIILKKKKKKKMNKIK